MKSGKSWINKLTVIAVIIVVVAVGISFVIGNDRNDSKQVVQKVQQDKQMVFHYMQKGGQAAFGSAAPRVERMVHDRFEHHDGWNAAIAAGGIILVAGLAYVIFKRRKKAGRRGVDANYATPVTISSTADFLDQWEKQQNK